MGLSGKRFLDVAGSREAIVTVLASITSLYYLIVAVTNCIDTDTNRRGVQAVLSMEATIHHSGVDWRAITNSTVILIAYILIVIWEYLTGFVLLAAAVTGWSALIGRNSAKTAVAAKLSSLGWTMAVLLFAGGFLTIGGEWFRMWANKQVNATSAALQNFLLAGIGLILVHMSSRSETRVSEPSVESDAPSTESNAPSAEGDTPSAEADTPATESTPSAESDTPNTQGDTPSTASNAPSGESDTPSTQADTQSAESNAPSGQSDTPTTEGDTPSEGSTAPSTEGDAPSGETDTPSADSDTPSAESDTPSAESDTPPKP